LEELLKEGSGGIEMSGDIDYVEQVKEIAEKLNCHIRGGSVKSLLKYYLLASEDEKSEIREDIDSIVGFHLPKLVFSRKPMLPSPEKEEINGEIKIGKVFQGNKELYDFGISKEELNQHMLIVARSGFGKTTLIIQIMRQLIENKIPFIVFDYKRDYRHLIRHFQELVVLSWRDLRINPLEPPPGVSFQEWKQQFLNIFGHVQAVWHGSTQYLLEAIDKACEEKKGLVTLEDVYKKIVEANETTKKMQEYASVVETRLYGLLSKLGETINNERTLIDMEKLLQLPVVIELDGLGRDEASILALWLFYWIYAYRKAKSIRGRLLHVLIIDEAKRIFTASEQYSQTTTEYSGVPPADLVCDEIRDFGEAIIASDQEPTKLSDSLKANTYTKITGYLGNGKDINDIAEAMDLSEDERKVITKLERGEWLVKLAGRYVKPFTIRTEDFPIKKNVSNEELRQKMKPIIESLLKASKEKVEKVEEVSLSEDSWKILESINSHPFNGIVSRQRELGISVKRFEKVKQELISRGLVKQLSISLSKRRPTSFLVLTDKALQILEAKGLDTSVWKHVGNVGFEHMLYQVLIRWELKKLGYDAHIEVDLANGRRIDVLAIKNGKKVGVEVELNVNVDLKQKLSEVESVDELYIVTSKELFNEIREKLGDLPINVKLYSIDRFLENLGNLFGEETGNNSFSRNNLKINSSCENQSNSGFSRKEKLGGKGIGEG
jgi:hypothetical protein